MMNGNENRIQELEEALRAAEEANRAKSRFLSSMSHDIRTPMNAIAGMTAIALSHIDEKARVQDCLQKIQTASSHLMSLVNDVLDMSRIDSGRLALNEEQFDLADLVHDVAVIVRPQAREKGQEFRLEIGRVRQELLLGDPLRLRQILVNIISNAVKYTPEGGIVRISFSQRVEPERVWLDFVCEDNGIGMSGDFLLRIFQPFERVRTAQVSRIEGTGLGMSIVKNLVDQMKGTISVESREGEGSRFTVALPFPAAARETRTAFLPGRTVLVAEARDAGQTEECLREIGLEPVRLAAGLEAVAWLTEARCEGRMPCAMLLGQSLADMPVLDAARHVRQLAGREFPILLASEEDWASMEYQATRAGVSAFVPCPIFPSRLYSALSQLLAGEQETAGDLSGQEEDYSAFRALLVEDNELNQEIAIELLGMTGVQVETAGDGAQALEKFSASPEGWFNLIFMDVQMPVMDGYEATRRIRALPRRDAKRIWIVAMTANAFIEDVRLSQEAGMDEHISKPVDLKRLKDTLRRLLPQERDGAQTGEELP
ncbi:MAG: response regulator [Oscillospiraceae bacterium]|jgi:two-component system sensor histidine kinase/response regulator|nr:response regulator [Oscillospiraceae bacterium]